MAGANRSEKITAGVEVEDEKVTGEAPVDAVVTQMEVGIEGDRMCNVFVALDVLLHVELLGRTVGRLNTPWDHFNRDPPAGLDVFSDIDRS